MPLSPDCVVGKCRACAGDALDVVTDDIVGCGCDCHREQCAAIVRPATRVDEAERCEALAEPGTNVCAEHEDDADA